MQVLSDFFEGSLYFFLSKIMELLDGRRVSKEILQELSEYVGKMHLAHIHPKLAVILVGQDPASLSYIRQKQKACDVTGIEWEQHDFSVEVTTEELISKIRELNTDETIHGILMQLPLPRTVATPEVLKAIDPRKDVDGITAYSLGKTLISENFEYLAPCTPKGVIRLLEYYKIPIKGQEVVVIGHSIVVGKPLAAMLLNRDATVTVCNVFTKDVKFHTKNADIVCVAVGKLKLLTADMVKDDVCIVDIGINQLENGTITGDVDFEEVSKKAKFITPVPGGIGPMTVACLMENTVNAAKKIHHYNP